MNIWAIRVRAVAKVPVIRDCGHTAGCGERRKRDRLPGICPCGYLRLHSWSGCRNARVDALIILTDCAGLVLEPYRGHPRA